MKIDRVVVEMHYSLIDEDASSLYSAEDIRRDLKNDLGVDRFRKFSVSNNSTKKEGSARVEGFLKDSMTLKKLVKQTNSHSLTKGKLPKEVRSYSLIAYSGNKPLYFIGF